jgi:polyisoprenoid-binding protein YceI
LNPPPEYKQRWVRRAAGEWHSESRVGRIDPERKTQDLALRRMTMTRSRAFYVTVVSVLAGAWATQAAVATEFTIDPAHSSIIFKVKNRDISYVYGRFNDISGTIVTDKPQDPTSVEVKIEVQAKSIDTNNKERDVHLKDADFLNAKKNATITFEGKTTKQLDRGKFEIKGELGLRGVKKEVTVILEQTGSKRVGAAFRFGGQSTFTIKRSDFGMDQMLDQIADEVTIMVNMEGEFKLPPTG